MRIVLDQSILAVIYGRFQDFNEDFTDFTKDFRISTEISGFRERFQISREISGEVYEISISGGPLGKCAVPGVYVIIIIIIIISHTNRCR